MTLTTVSTTVVYCDVNTRVQIIIILQIPNK